MILGCGLAEFSDSRGKKKHGAQQLYWILMSESAYLIWKLQNNRVISWDGLPVTKEEIINKWKFTVNQRLQTDIILANRPIHGKPCTGKTTSPRDMVQHSGQRT
jgi:ribonuclease HI